MKKLLVTSALSLALAMAAGAANATTFNLNVSNGSASIFSPNYADNQSFNDVFNFTIGNVQKLSASITATFVTNSNGGVKTFVLENLSSSQTIGSTKRVYVDGDTTYTTLTIKTASLAAGNYALLVTGKGSYGGALHLTSAVPEASTTAMMLGGLALVGFAASRRRRKEDGKSFAPSALAAA